MMLTTLTVPISVPLASDNPEGIDWLHVAFVEQLVAAQRAELVVGRVQEPDAILCGAGLGDVPPLDVDAVGIQRPKLSRLEGAADDAKHLDRREPPQRIML